MFSSRQCGARLASIGSEWRINEKSSAKKGVEKVLEKTTSLLETGKNYSFSLFLLRLKAAGWWATEDLYTFLYTRVRR